MRSFRTRRRVAHSARDMFELTADVERYPEFVPLCRALTVRGRSLEGGNEVIVADMTAAYKNFSETFTSRVVLDREALTIDTAYLEGPFRHLANRWRFEPEGERACTIDFFIEYEFRNFALQLAAGAVFEAAFRRFAEAFERRADEVYGAAGKGAWPH